LVADGETTVHAIDHIDRGYVDFEKQLRKLGANIVRETNPQLS
jgi:UDP-N-acetylglucosamine 1-carboxyvinyltransferase